jgi:hypothetical protein
MSKGTHRGGAREAWTERARKVGRHKVETGSPDEIPKKVRENRWSLFRWVPESR